MALTAQPINKEVRKAQVLEAVARLTQIRGYPPSYRDLADDVGIAHSAVFYVVETLRTDGLIHEREAKHSRAITLTDTGRLALGGLLKGPRPTR